MNIGTNNAEKQEYFTKRKLTSSFNRLKFLKDCILEQVLPKSAPLQLKNKGDLSANFLLKQKIVK